MDDPVLYRQAHGDKSSDGDQWQHGNETVTVNPTDDPKAPGGYYVCVKDNETEEKATAVYNEDGTFADVKANKHWRNA